MKVGPPHGSWWRGWTRFPAAWSRYALLSGLAMVLGIGVVHMRRDTECAAEDREPTLAAVRVTPGSDAQRAEVLGRVADVWSERTLEPTIDVVADFATRAWLAREGIEFSVLVPDVMAVAEAERERLSSAEVARPTPEQWFSEYRDLTTIHAHLDTLAALRPDLASVETIGQSLEGRPLQALRIRGKGKRKFGMVVDGGLHAREWIAMMVSTCVADRLIRGYDSDPRLRRFVDRAELVVVPVANPDGYVHSWERDRYWRKNRRGSHGVDLNRNFGYAWGGDGSSSNPASQVYRGEAPFSEPEAVALRDLMRREDIAAHIDFHSYGQLLLHPWSYTRDHARDHKRLTKLAKGMEKAIRAEHGKRYTLMPAQSLYPAAGTMMDWAYGERQASSFVIELRPKGGSGFVLPPDQIIPTCDEGLAAVLSLAEAVGG